MLAFALIVLAATATAATAALLRGRRARWRGLAPPPGALPVGVKLLVSGVSDLSGLGLHLRAAPPSSRPRLGAALGDR
jgi:hypothetical protein